MTNERKKESCAPPNLAAMPPTNDGGAEAEETEERETCVDAADWLAEADEPDNPLVENLIEVGEMVAIVGQSKAGKSFLALQIAVCAALGRDFLGRRVARRRVYIANLEVSRKQYKKRLRRLIGALGADMEALRGWLFVDNLKGENASWGVCFQRCVDRDCAVCFIDPFYQIFKGDESSVEDVQRAIGMMKQFQRAALTLIVVFHSPKGFNGDRQLIDMISGSSLLARFPETIIGLMAHARDERLRVIKAIVRNYAPPDDQVVRYDGGAFAVEEDEEAVVASSENHAGMSRRPSRAAAPAKPTAAEEVERLAEKWAQDLRGNYIGVSARDIATEIQRVEGVSASRANRVAYRLRELCARHGVRYDADYDQFAPM